MKDLLTGARRLLLLLITLLALSIAGCGRQAAPPAAAAPTPLAVFAAASLSTAFEDLGDRFQETHPDYQVIFNFAGSQELAQQISQGAPADVFASADRRQMEVVVDSGQILPDQVQPFAHNRLVLVVPAANPAGVEGVQDLAQPGLQLVLADEAVPAGRYARTMLQRAADGALGQEFLPAVRANVVSYEQNVRAVLTKVVLGEADAGVVYYSDLAATTSGQVDWFEIPDAYNVRAVYPIAALHTSEHAEQAAAFIDFVLSPAGQTILSDHGFVPLQSTVE